MPRDEAALEVVRRHAVSVDDDSAAARLLDAIVAVEANWPANAAGARDAQAGFYALHLYRLHRRGYACVDAFSDDAQLYGNARCAVGFATHQRETTASPALEPPERWVRHDADLPETYPTGV